MRRAFLGVGMMALLVATPAYASPSARLVYGRSGDAGACPDEAALRRAVAARLGYDPFFPWAPKTVVATMVGQDGHLTARVEIVDDHAESKGARDLTVATTDCAPLFDALALTISIALDPHALTRAPSERSVAEPAAQPLAPPPPTVARDARATAPKTRRESAPPPRSVGTERGGHPHLGLRLDTRGAWGLEPAPAVGLLAGPSITWRRFSSDLVLGAYLPGGARDASGAEARAWLALAEGTLCVELEPTRLCALGALGRIEGSSRGAPTARTESAIFVAAGGRVGVDVLRQGPVSLGLAAVLVANLSPATLRIGAEPVWRAPRVAASLGPSGRLSF